MTKRIEVKQMFPLEELEKACKKNNISGELLEIFKNVYEGRFGDFSE